MDEEGFSGLNGRTTIFDWWSVSSIRRLRKVIASGQYRQLSVSGLVKDGLKRDEAQTFVRFAQALRFAASNQAIQTGSTYDLCYCNVDSEGFDKDCHFAFLRYNQEDKLLIASNFSMETARMKIYIPQEADCEGPTTLEITVPSMDGVVLQLI